MSGSRVQQRLSGLSSGAFAAMLLGLAPVAWAQMPAEPGAIHMVLGVKFALMCLLLLTGAICVAFVAMMTRRRKPATAASDDWSEMEAQLARMEERVENLATILSDRN